MSSENRHSRKQGHRWQRIQHIVADAFNCDLLPSLEDPALQGLQVRRVKVKGLSCIEVQLCHAHETGCDSFEIESALERASHWLRRELAEVVRLKRTPDLRLIYFPLPLLPDSQEMAGGDDE